MTASSWEFRCRTKPAERLWPDVLLTVGEASGRLTKLGPRTATFGLVLSALLYALPAWAGPALFYTDLDSGPAGAYAEGFP